MDPRGRNPGYRKRHPGTPGSGDLALLGVPVGVISNHSRSQRYHTNITEISEHVFSGSQHLRAAQTALTDPRRPRGRKGRFWGLFWAYFGTLFLGRSDAFLAVLAVFDPFEGSFRV